MDYFAHRRAALARAVAADGVDALLVTHPANVTYLTGFTGDSSYLAVAASGKSLLVSDSRFEQQIAEEAGKGVEVVIRPHDQRVTAAAAAAVTKMDLRAVAIEADHATLAVQATIAAAGPKLTLTALAGKVEALRAVKDPGEVERIRHAVRVAERAFNMFRALLRETDTEKDLADAMDAHLRRSGARGSAFPPIIAVGERGALPHAPPTGRMLSDGSKVLVDWGADVGYKSDLTRTFRAPFGAAPTRRNKPERVGYNLEEIHAAVEAAHVAAVAKLRAGATGKEVDAAARKSLAGAKLRDGGRGVDLEKHFTHGLGHGLGLEVHEAPSLRANSADVLEAGNVVTIEPGVYLPGWGGVRLEDDYLVTEDGSIRLSTLPRDAGAIG